MSFFNELYPSRKLRLPCSLNTYKLLRSMALCSIVSLTRFCFSTGSSSSSYSTFHLNHFSRSLIAVVSTRNHRWSCVRMAASSASSSLPMQDKITAPYGSWKSPITADVVSGASKQLGGTAVDAHGRLIWLESRPTESGYVHINIIRYLYVYMLPTAFNSFLSAPTPFFKTNGKIDNNRFSFSFLFSFCISRI